MNKTPNRRNLNAVIEKEASTVQINEKHVFSAGYSQKKNRLVIGEQGEYKHRKVKLALAVLFILILLAACVKPVRDFAIQIYREFTGYSYQTPLAETGVTIEVENIPGGYTEISRTESPYMTNIVYGNQEGKYINIIFSSDETVQKYIDNENFTQEEIITINGSKGYLFASTNSNDRLAVLQTDYGVLEINAQLDKETLIKIANGIHIKGA